MSVLAYHIVLVSLGAFAVLLGVAGWLLPLQDGVARFTCRYLAAGAWFVALIWAVSASPRNAPLWVWALTFGLATGPYGRAKHWWRETEKRRTVARIVAEHHARGTDRFR